MTASPEKVVGRLSFRASLRSFRVVNGLDASPRHVQRNMRNIRAFLRFTGAESLDEITTSSIQNWIVHLADRGLKPKTLQDYLNSVSRFCRYLADLGVFATNPCRGVTMPRKTKQPPIYLSAIEYDLTLELARKFGIHCEVCLALNTGLRMTELRLLEWRDVDFDQRTLMVRNTKDRAFRTVPLNQRAIAALRKQHRVSGMRPYIFPGGRRRKDGHSGKGPWDLNKPRRENWWVNALIPLQEKIPTFQLTDPGSVGRGWHLFRHTFASRAVQAGVPIFTVSNWLGHKDVKTTMIYAHLGQDFDPDIEKV